MNETAVTNHTPLIRCCGLVKSFGAKRALDGVELEIGRGRIVGLLGPNGSGKTTLIKLLCGLLQPSAGFLMIDGREPGVHTKGITSYLPDRMSLPMWMNAQQLLNFYADFYADFDEQRAGELLTRLRVAPEQRVKHMSKGTQEKVQLVLTMSRRARLYLLDEPIGGVDPATRDFILSTIMTNYAEDAAVIISTHLISDVERVLDDVVFIDHGRVVMSGEADEVRERSGKSVDELFREVFRC